MANQQQANVLSDARVLATELHDAAYKLVQIRARFQALGGAGGFQGAGKLFAVDGSGQEIPFNDFLGMFNALGALEADTEWPAFLDVIARSRA